MYLHILNRCIDIMGKEYTGCVGRPQPRMATTVSPALGGGHLSTPEHGLRRGATSLARCVGPTYVTGIVNLDVWYPVKQFPHSVSWSILHHEASNMESLAMR